MILEEGLSRIKVPGNDTLKGPGTKRAGFYNTDQVLNRDITVSVISALRPKSYLDGFGGTGVRGIRVSKEAGIHSVVSDINKRSAEIINENVKMNDVDVDVYNEPFESVVSRYLFDFIDVDPYGSIVPFLDVAITHVKNGGYLGLTATDLSALTGSVSSKTGRRYNAFISNDRLKHESGLRLMLAYVARRAAALDREMTPILAFWKSHYYRIIVRIKHGVGLADKCLKNVQTVNKAARLATIYPSIDEGPIWVGNLSTKTVVENASSLKLEGIRTDSYDLLRSLPNEDERLYFFELSDFASALGKSLPRIEKLKEQIQKETGKAAFRTHFSGTGLKADISGETFYRIFDEWSVR